MKRSLTIIATIIVLAGIGVVGYLYFKNKAPAVVVTPTPDTTLPTSGDALAPSEASTTPAETPVTEIPTFVPPRLVKVAVGPVVPGTAVIATKGNASSSPDVLIEYIERQSGNIFTYLKNSGSLVRTSNKTLPGIQSAQWFPDGSFAVVRYLSGSGFTTLNTYAISKDGTTGFFLPQNLADVSVSSSTLLTIASGVNGSSASLTRADGSHPTTVFTTPLTSLRASFAGKSQYLVFTKPSATLEGDAFLVSNGRFSRIAGPQNGLVALASPSGKWVLTSSSENGSLQTNLINTATGESLNLPIATIVDKCVWAKDESAAYCGVPKDAPNASYPDDWYQGAVHFGDRIWKIQTSGRYVQLVLDFSKETNSTLDAISLALDPQQTTLVFMNKNDGSLWSYSL